MHKRFCLLGVEDSLYTKAMAYEFERKNKPYAIILVKKRKRNIKLFSNFLIKNKIRDINILKIWNFRFIY